jgi:hypothetical protein
VEAAIVAAYWDNYRLKYTVDPPDDDGAERAFWGWEAVHAIIEGPQAVAMLQALADAAPDDPRALAFLGADAIEDYLVRAPVAPDIDAVVAAAERDEKFRTALRSAWFDQHLADPDAGRLRAFGPPP